MMEAPADRPDAAPKSADADIGALVMAARGGCPEAIDRLLAWAEAPLFRFVRQLCGDVETALDVVQETLIELLRQLPSLRRPASVKHWLFRVAARKAERQRDRRRREVPLASADWFETQDTPALRGMLEAERAERVRNAVRLLPPPMRAALVLTVVEGFSVAEAARICHTRAGTIKSRLFHARRLLRKWLADYGPKDGSP